MSEPADSPIDLSPAGELPVLGGELGERADARRNRLKILEAAERLFAENGCEAVSMDAVAEAAGVGKGTLYRRFGDRSGLARAVLNEREREFQESLIRGEPPLGPGAPPAARLVAFGHGVLELVESHGDLIMAAQHGRAGARFAGPVYATYRQHVAMLLGELDPRIDSGYFADVLLAALNAEMYDFWRAEAGITHERLADGFAELVRAVAASVG